MSVERRPSSVETSSLLEEAPPSYRSVDDVNDGISSTDYNENAPSINQFSGADTFWILAGLWSGVFLGAFDGMFTVTWLNMLSSLQHLHRYSRCHTANAYRKRIQRVKSIVIHRDVLFVICLLFYAPLW